MNLEQAAPDSSDASCTCRECVDACKHYPGWMTPEEADKAINEGLAKRLMLDWFCADKEFNYKKIFVLCPASLGYEGKKAPEDIGFSPLLVGYFPGRCTFLKNDRCEIHSSGHKPMHCREGRACVDDGKTGYGEKIKVARLWNTTEGKALLRKWRKLVK